MGAPAPQLPVATGEVVAGKYLVERVVGSGGMGVIVAARHLQLDQQVALKFLHPHVLSSDQSVARFLREAKSTVRLKSDHVARVYDVDTLPNGAPYAVMELLEGVDLATYARTSGPLRIADAVEFVVQACEGIVEAHALGIVHRDLKPQNLFVTRRVNGSPRIKVLDFGISKSIGGADFSLTDSAVVLGSPLYMSPEQMKASRNVDVRSDVWSLGVILYELVCGKVPFDGESITELCLKVVTAPPPPPREMRTDIPEALAAIVLRCLEKDVNLRFPSVAALAEALEPFSAGAERGVTDRTWRSLAETADALDRRSMAGIAAGAAPTSTPPVANTHSTWDRQLEPQRRPGFVRGLVVGLGFAVVLGAGLTYAFSHRGAPAVASVAAPQVTVAVSSAPSPAPSAPPEPPPVASAAPEVAPPVASTREAVGQDGVAVRGGSVPIRALPTRPRRFDDAPVVRAAAAADAGAAFRTSANGSPILP